MKNMDKKKIERVKGLLDGVDAGIVATENGVAVFGRGIEILNLISNIANSVKKNLKKEDVKKAFDMGLNGVGIPVDKLDKKELDKMAEEIVKDLKKALDEMFSEEN